jgi:hypothetical protein
MGALGTEPTSGSTTWSDGGSFRSRARLHGRGARRSHRGAGRSCSVCRGRGDGGYGSAEAGAGAAQALESGGWFAESQDDAASKAAATDGDEERLTAIRTLIAEETRVGMLVGVAIGWALATELNGYEPERAPKGEAST